MNRLWGYLRRKSAQSTDWLATDTPGIVVARSQDFKVYFAVASGSHASNKLMHELHPLLKAVGLALLVGLGLQPVARGAFPDTQVLRGEVVDQRNTPIAGAVCTLTGPLQPEGGRPITTGEHGEFEFTGLIPGTYQLTCAAVSYIPVAQNDIRVSDAEAPTIQVTLPTEVIVRQRVEVSAQATKVTTEATAPAAVISNQQLRSLPLAEQKFKAALPLIPGVVRTPDGRIAIKGAVENTGTLLVDSAETVDPVTGSFSIEIPIDAVESVNVFKSAYQAEYGRFSGGLTTVETKAPSSQWHFELNDFVPTPRILGGHLVGILNDTPRLYFSGPIWKDKLTFSESFIYDIVRNPVRGLTYPDNEVKKQGATSFTDFYYVFSAQHFASVNIKLFPYRRQYDNLASLIPQNASADYGQTGYSVGGNDHWLFSSGGILTTLVQFTRFDSYSHGQGPQDLLVTPEGWQGNFFNSWTRESQQLEVQQSYQLGRRQWHGKHNVKAGGDIVHRSYDGVSVSHSVQVFRTDNSVATQIDFSPAGPINPEDSEFAGFIEDHWTFNDYLAWDYGLRVSGQTLGVNAAFSPRGGLVFSPRKSGKTIFRTGAGVFYGRLPLLAGDYTNNPTRTVTRFDAEGVPLGPPRVYQNFYEAFKDNGTQIFPSGQSLGSTPYNTTWNAEFDQELRPDVIARVSYLGSLTHEEFTINPKTLAPGNSVMLLSNLGSMRYHEFDATLRVRPSDKADFSISYVNSSARGDLNTLATVFVPYEQPVIRPDYYGTLPTNVSNRLVTWGRFRVPRKVTISPLLDVHSGFPFSAVDVYDNYVGIPNSLRYPTFLSFDTQVSKDFRVPFIPWVRHHTLRGAIRVFNITNHGNFRDVYNNVTSPLYGNFTGFQHRSYDLSLDVDY